MRWRLTRKSAFVLVGSEFTDGSVPARRPCSCRDRVARQLRRRRRHLHAQDVVLAAERAVVAADADHGVAGLAVGDDLRELVHRAAVGRDAAGGADRAGACRSSRRRRSRPRQGRTARRAAARGSSCRRRRPCPRSGCCRRCRSSRRCRCCRPTDGRRGGLLNARSRSVPSPAPSGRRSPSSPARSRRAGSGRSRRRSRSRCGRRRASPLDQRRDRLRGRLVVVRLPVLRDETGCLARGGVGVVVDVDRDVRGLRAERQPE